MASRLSDAERAIRAYCASVLSGKRVTGKLEQLAVARHRADLAAVKSGARTDIYFDRAAAQDVCDFFPLLKHTKGQWAGQPFHLAPWQQFVVSCLFGWKRADGTRRFHLAYIEIARKNGKTSWAAGIGLYLAFFDGEPGAECYAIATKKDQARICHAEAVKMSRRNREMGLESGSAPPEKASAIYSTLLGSKFDALGADADTTDGLNVHGAIVDEYHAHKSRDLFDRIDTATGARREPMIVIITTAGDDERSPCYQQRDDARMMLEGITANDSLFAFVAAPDPGDDWMSPSTWAKGNPNLGVSVHLDRLAEQCANVAQSPTKQNAFRRFRLNEWTRATTRFLSYEQWNACAGPLPVAKLESALLGGLCYAGLDLSSKSDTTSLCMVFPPEDLDKGTYDVLWRFWLPEGAIEHPDRPKNVPYEQWADAGLLQLTPGERIDQAFILREVGDLAAKYRIHELMFDSWGAQFLAPQFEEMGLVVAEHRQGFKSMSEPTKQLDVLVAEARIRHGGHPVAAWQADCLEVATDEAENLKPVKPRFGSRDKRIDGLVAFIMALGRAMLLGVNPPDDRSIYEERGMLEL